MAGHPVNKNLGMPDEMVMDGKGTANQTAEFKIVCYTVDGFY